MTTQLDLLVAQISEDATTLHEVVHGNATTVVNLPGGDIPSLTKLVTDGQAAIDAVDSAAAAQVGLAAAQVGLATTQAGIATTQAGTATTQAGLASTSRIGADNAKTQAELYAALAATGAKFYDTIALGRAGVADTFTFGVKAGGTDGLVRPTVYRRDSSSTQTLLYAIIPASEFDSIVSPQEMLAYEWAVRDDLGRVPLGVRNDGTVDVDTMQVTNINGTTITALQAATAQAQADAGRASVISTVVGVTPVFMVNDDKGRTALNVYSDGSVGIAELAIPSVNGFDVRSRLRPTSWGTYRAELILLINTGQSLSSGGGPAITTAQEYDNIGFPNWSVSPASYLTLTAQNCSQGGDAECPMFGASGYIKALLVAEKHLTYNDHNYQLLSCDNSHGSYSILALNKGNPLYAAGISQAAAMASIAATELRTCSAGGIFWAQGESDAAMTASAYQTYLQQLATDYNTDLKAATGQTADVPFITYQTCSNATRTVALGQLAAHITSPLVYMACPMYQFEYLPDGVHIVPTSSKWLGAYFGLVQQRITVDGVAWEPTRPLSAVCSGRLAYVTFNATVKPLVFDTAAVPAQANYGFTLVTSAGVDIPITSVDVSGPDVIKIIANSTIPVGAKLRYGFNAATGMGGFVGGAGNLRDSQGDTVPLAAGKRLDNWCVIFEFQIL